jgi:hypothetical protein
MSSAFKGPPEVNDQAVRCHNSLIIALGEPKMTTESQHAANIEPEQQLAVCIILLQYAETQVRI